MRNARTIRESRGLTLEQVSRETGLAFSLIGRFEREELWMGEGNLARLRDFYGVSTDDLIRKASPAGAETPALGAGASEKSA